jgi:hypothetical protein
MEHHGDLFDKDETRRSVSAVITNRDYLPQATEEDHEA